MSIEKWYSVQPEYANGWWVVSKDPEGYKPVDESGDGGFEEQTAKLVAASPELLIALEQLLLRISSDADAKSWFVDEQNRAKEAIKKAKGLA